VSVDCHGRVHHGGWMLMMDLQAGRRAASGVQCWLKLGVMSLGAGLILGRRRRGSGAGVAT